ncbi:hypothetical protein PJ985_16120 [Streptomyces sp. ACA25]|uniref:hypothetical protein n=1 Tax=Streptomyces sp. ACA25 TaxID=3022596 RepID=UPI002307DC86|nr:hypothetical protein [Streptomyces sp. ACA25]MDB1089088.1 hypothetical protein [Streptomyces sp. ACA25]
MRRGVRRRPVAVAGLLCAAGLAAVGCGGDSGGPEPATGSGGPGSVTMEITVSGRTVEPPPGRTAVPRGAEVTLHVTGDTADEVHVHGYDRLAELHPGERTTLFFTADRTGLFEVETHGSGLVLTQLEVR